VTTSLQIQVVKLFLKLKIINFRQLEKLKVQTHSSARNFVVHSKTLARYLFGAK